MWGSLGNYTVAAAVAVPSVEQHLQALVHFKDWSNFMLVTTVAALGWVASKDHPRIKPHDALASWAIGLFTLSVIFSIFTLALIPLVAEAITPDTKSFYDLTVSFDLVYLWGPDVGLKLKSVCWLQHLFFILGVVTYALANFKETGRFLLLLGVGASFAFVLCKG